MEFDARAHYLRGFLISGSYPFALIEEVAESDAFSFGVEEEFFLVDARTFQAAAETPDGLFETADAVSEGHIKREFLQAQAEAISSKHSDLAEARRELVNMRQTLAAAARKHGLAIM